MTPWSAVLLGGVAELAQHVTEVERQLAEGVEPLVPRIGGDVVDGVREQGRVVRSAYELGGVGHDGVDACEERRGDGVGEVVAALTHTARDRSEGDRKVTR